MTALNMKHFIDVFGRFLSTYRRVVIMLCVGLVLLWVFDAQVARLLQYAKIVPIQEKGTEIYFDTYPGSLSTLIPDSPIEFSYTIHNQTGGVYAYRTVSSIETVKGERILIDERSALMSKDETRTFSESFIYDPSMASGTVKVLLLDQDQEIHFTLTK